MMERAVLGMAVGPHVHDGSRTSWIMNGYLLALLPAAIWGCIRYGVPGIRTLLLAAGSAVIWEWAARRLMKQGMTLHDVSAIVQGLLLGMMLPANSSFWIIIIGTFLMIVVAKQIFGGIGSYPFNPVLIGFAILSVSWPIRMSSHFTMAGRRLEGLSLEPLSALKSYGPSVTDVYNPVDLLLGFQTGGIGTGAVLLLVIGGLYLMARGFISYRVSLSFLLGVAITACLFHVADSSKYAGPSFHLLAGVTVFGAFFLASDYTTCPVNPIARIIYGFAAGMLIILIRNIGAYTDGTVFALLILNLFHPLIDRIRKSVLGLNVSRLKMGQ
jgi:electron transport complex protein RnfD